LLLAVGGGTSPVGGSVASLGTESLPVSSEVACCWTWGVPFEASGAPPHATEKPELMSNDAKPATPSFDAGLRGSPVAGFRDSAWAGSDASRGLGEPSAAGAGAALRGGQNFVMSDNFMAFPRSGSETMDGWPARRLASDAAHSAPIVSTREDSGELCVVISAAPKHAYAMASLGADRHDRQ